MRRNATINIDVVTMANKVGHVRELIYQLESTKKNLSNRSALDLAKQYDRLASLLLESINDR